MFLILTVLLFSTPYQLQKKYDYCRSINFEAKDGYCNTQVKLHAMGGKNDK